VIKVSTAPAHEVKESLKAGAKRKLSVREDDDQVNGIAYSGSSPDNFQFTRVVSDEKIKNTTISQPETTTAKTIRELAVARGASREKRSTATIASGRKALAPKSVNNSPKKVARGPATDEVKAAKAVIQRFGVENPRSRERNREPILVKSQPEPIADIIEVQPEPETPAAVDIFSPSSSQPSTARLVDSRDTPPPPDLNSGIEGVRPSRRARGAVSYAEPSLRDKMRRPSKALANAVNKDGKIVQGATIKSEEGCVTSITIKAEPEDEDAWKCMAPASTDTVENSPLRTKATENDLLPSSITTHRKRRESILHHIQSNDSKPTYENTISALVAERRKAKAFAREKALEQEGSNLAKSMECLDVNEFNGPSPTDISNSQSVREEKSKSRPTRRQSSMARDLTVSDDGDASDIEATKRRQVTVSRRRQSTLDGHSGSLGQTSERLSALKKSCSTQDMANRAPDDARSDRVSSRRRSMML
jgi:hypothetical protein